MNPLTNGPRTRVELILSAKNIADRDLFSKSDPICVVFNKPSRVVSSASAARGGGNYAPSAPHWQEVGRTECIDNCLSPQWMKKIQLDYCFEERQPLKFELYDVDSPSPDLANHDFLGGVECELAEVVAAQGGALTRPIIYNKKKCGELTVRAEELDEGQKESLYLVCHGRQLDKKDFFGKSDPFLEFYRLSPTNGGDGPLQQVMVHRSEVIKKTLDPEWRPFEVLVRHLCEGDKDREFLIECWDWDRDGGSSHDLIGRCRTTVNELVGRRQMSIPLINEKKRQKKGAKYKDSGTLHFLQVELRREYTFLDFIGAGMQLEFAVVVDFTASNGPVHSSSSLHYISQQAPNQYETAIGAVLEICEFYNHSRVFEAMGFGAKVPPNFEVSHLFPLKLDTFDRYAVGVEGVLGAYRTALVNTQLYGPTNFSPTINEFANKARRLSADGAHYQILLILTDGIITDMERTIAAIIEASSLPLSIIIVGVGNEDFAKMDALDSDDALLSQGGRSAHRDIVQFVPFRNFLHGLSMSAGDTPARLAAVKAALAKEVFAELPNQVTSYMKSRGISPLPMTTRNYSNAGAPTATAPHMEAQTSLAAEGYGEPPPSYQQATGRVMAAGKNAAALGGGESGAGKTANAHGSWM